MTLEHFSKLNIFRNPFVTPGMGSGDDLVTIWVCSTHGNPRSGYSTRVARAIGPLKPPILLFVGRCLVAPDLRTNCISSFPPSTTVLDPLHVFFTLLGCLDGGGGLGHKMLMQFSTLGSSKMEISETDFFFLS